MRHSVAGNYAVSLTYNAATLLTPEHLLNGVVVGFAHWPRYRHSLGVDRAHTRPAQAAHLGQNSRALDYGSRAVAARDPARLWLLRRSAKFLPAADPYPTCVPLELRYELAHSDQTVLDCRETVVCAQKAPQSGKHGALAAAWPRRGLTDLEGKKLPSRGPAERLSGRKELLDIDHAQTSQNSEFDCSKFRLVSPKSSSAPQTVRKLISCLVRHALTLISTNETLTARNGSKSSQLIV